MTNMTMPHRNTEAWKACPREEGQSCVWRGVRGVRGMCFRAEAFSFRNSSGSFFTMRTVYSDVICRRFNGACCCLCVFVVCMCLSFVVCVCCFFCVFIVVCVCSLLFVCVCCCCFYCLLFLFVGIVSVFLYSLFLFYFIFFILNSLFIFINLFLVFLNFFKNSFFTSNSGRKTRKGSNSSSGGSCGVGGCGGGGCVGVVCGQTVSKA